MPLPQFTIRAILWATALVAASVVLGQQASVQRRADLFIVLMAGSAGCFGGAVGSLFGRPSLGSGIAIVLTLAFVLLALIFVMDL
jgi:hypothetical protein